MPRKPASKRSRKRTGKSRAAARRAIKPVPAPVSAAIVGPAPTEIDEEAQSAATLDQADLPPFMVAGVGASAGGLEACSMLLRAMPRDVGVALIIVQHLSPGHDSMMPQLLAGRTALPVAEVTDGMRIEPNRVFVIPPSFHLEIVQACLRLRPRPADRTQHMPIDHFFRSLAEYAQSRAIGIILSGSASDGAIGMQEIKANGGIAIVQEPRTARNDGMPRAAIGTGVIDLVLPPDLIAAELARIAASPLVARLARAAGPEPEIHDEHFGRILRMLRTASGVDFAQYKQPTIRRRLQRRMVLHKIGSFEDYVAYLEQNPAEIGALYQDILIHVTRFFRDSESFEALTSGAFGSMAGNRAGDAPIRVWIPGCSTGEEAYSVAIALIEFLGERADDTPVQIFATDVSDTAIDHARAGVYPESIAADVSPERLRRFFTKTDGSYKVTKAVRDLCVFARQDLTRDPPFSRLDLIVCRNVLIYLGANLQRRLMNVFHYALRPMGFLMLGSAETVGPAVDLFSPLDKRHRLFTKKVAGERGDMGFGRAEAMINRSEGQRRPRMEYRPTSVQNEANHIVLARYSPAGVLVDDDLQVLQFRGQTGKFIEPPSGDPSLNILKMAREGLLYALRTALHEARKTGQSVRREGLRIRPNGGSIQANLEVVPMGEPPERRHFLILFEDATGKRAPRRPPTPKKTRKGGHEQRIRELEYEVAASREYLQSIIQDLEAANEELQSANEEILSANEELQSTNEELDTAKEELQSTNEELNTLNEELQGRNEELGRVNGDLMNLLASVQIAIVIVSGDLRIRRFTPMAEKLLNLIPGDVGRPIGDIKPNIDCPDLERLIAEAIDNVTTNEREVQDHSGCWFSLRIRPYKSVESRIDGAVIALFERRDGRTQEVRMKGEG